ncbi:MAG: orotidine-5'-phosphate decarboxylase [Patescibacteria group bacterium]
MATRNFMDLYQRRVRRSGNTVACVGLDPDLKRLPEHLRSVEGMAKFCIGIIDATQDLVCAFKPNIAFFDACGSHGREQLKHVMDYARQVVPDVPVILDAKRGDIGNTNAAYVQEAFDYFGADAITVAPYLGVEAMQPFLDERDKGVFVLCRTSNKGSGEFQELSVDTTSIPFKDIDSNLMIPRHIPLFQYVALRVSMRTGGWNAHGNCGLVVGATYPQDLAKVRELVGDDMPLLLPGFGKQGGEVQAAVMAGRNRSGGGIIANASSSIIFASSGDDYKDAARIAATAFRDELNQYRFTHPEPLGGK